MTDSLSAAVTRGAESWAFLAFAFATFTTLLFALISEIPGHGRRGITLRVSARIAASLLVGYFVLLSPTTRNALVGLRATLATEDHGPLQAAQSTTPGARAAEATPDCSSFWPLWLTAVGTLGGAIAMAIAAWIARSSAQAAQRAAEATERSATATRQAASGALMAQLLDRYARPEMAADLVALHDLQRQSPSEFAARWACAYLRGSQSAIDVDVARRRVSSYFWTADLLHQYGMLPREMWRAVVDVRGAAVFMHIVGPLERAKSSSADITAIDRLRDELGERSLADFLTPRRRSLPERIRARIFKAIAEER